MARAGRQSQGFIARWQQRAWPGARQAWLGFLLLCQLAILPAAFAAISAAPANSAAGPTAFPLCSPAGHHHAPRPDGSGALAHCLHCLTCTATVTGDLADLPGLLPGGSGGALPLPSGVVRILYAAMLLGAAVWPARRANRARAPPLMG